MFSGFSTGEAAWILCKLMLFLSCSIIWYQVEEMQKWLLLLRNAVPPPRAAC
jgi:hypothetical protein